jgi:spermidine/putrescine transport system ATP-binding protein
VNFRLRTATQLPPGTPLHVVVRPEDMRIYSRGEAMPENQPHFIGRIVERTYKGMTLDSVIELGDGTRVIASEFFDEDAPDFDHPLGEEVRVSWVPDWETLLPADNSANAPPLPANTPAPAGSARA